MDQCNSLCITGKKDAALDGSSELLPASPSIASWPEGLGQSHTCVSEDGAAPCPVQGMGMGRLHSMLSSHMDVLYALEKTAGRNATWPGCNFS